MYDYRMEIKDDIREWMDYEVDKKELWEEYGSIDRIFEKLYDDLFTEDSVTGNASGSYFFNSYRAEEALCHNLDLLAEAFAEFDCDTGYLLREGVEAADVTIRCYLLGECLQEVLDEIDWEEYE